MIDILNCPEITLEGENLSYEFEESNWVKTDACPVYTVISYLTSHETLGKV